MDLSSVSLDAIASADGGPKRDVAIIGIAARTPHATNKEEFWETVRGGLNLVGELKGQRKLDHDAYQSLLNTDKQYCRGAYLDEIDTFDYKYFQMTPKEAQLMDPGQRMLLENAMEAIDDAGYGGDRLKRTSTRIFIGYSGVAGGGYLDMIQKVEPDSLPLALVNNLNSMMGGRLAYLLDTRGAAEVIDTACASAFVAVHNAVRAINNGECTMAVASSVSLNMHPEDDENSKMGVESPDNITRPFDAESQGFGVGEGVVTFILKDKETAIRDRDAIYAVIKGSAIGQGGRSIGLTVTNPDALSDVMREAWKYGNITPDTISLLEMHGTGTRVGDPIEARAAQNAFASFTHRKSFCAAGSVKSNVGHLYEASGGISILKAIMALQNREIPPTLNVSTPNPEIDFTGGPLYINTKLRHWDQAAGPRRAAVTSLGLNGTNCHMVLEEYCPKEQHAGGMGQSMPDELPQQTHILVLSAKSEQALRILIGKYLEDARICGSEMGYKLEDICYTAAIGRGHEKYRLAVAFRNRKELQSRLTACLNRDILMKDESGCRAGLNEGSGKPMTVIVERVMPIQAVLDAYVSGFRLLWHHYFAHGQTKIVHLPTHPFLRERCWLQMATPETGGGLNAYEVMWKAQAVMYTQALPESILLIGDYASSLELYERHFEQHGCHCLTVRLGSDEMAGVLSTANSQGIRDIVLVAEANNHADIVSGRQLMSYISDFILEIKCLCQVLDLTSIRYISLNAQAVTGDEASIGLGLSSVSGFLKVLDKEYPGIRVQMIDHDGQCSVTRIIEQLTADEKEVGIRGDKTFLPYFCEYGKENICGEFIQPDLCYVISGGTGELALECVKAIATFEKASFILLGRSGVKSPAKIREIEALGSTVEIMQVDICNYDVLEKIATQITDKYHQVDRIVHCAGSDRSGFIKDLTAGDIQETVGAKIEGLLNLYRLLDSPCCQYLLFSSVATIFPAGMQSLYAAANSFLDSFADFGAAAGKKILTINWSTWKEIGMAKRNQVAEDLIFRAMPTTDAVNNLIRILSKVYAGRVVIGALNDNDFGYRLLRNSGVLVSEEILTRHNRVPGHVKTPKLITGVFQGKVQGVQEVQMEIINACKRIFGFDSIEIDDNFFEMGADSLLIMNLQRDLNKRFQNMLEVSDFFEYSTVRRLADYLTEQLGPELKRAGASVRETAEGDIAVVGIGLKVPGASDREELFEVLKQGLSIGGNPPLWRQRFIYDYILYRNETDKKLLFEEGAYLEDVDKFDYRYFGISPREAQLMDPHQRLLMETAVHTMEDAGYGGGKLWGTKTGVFLGYATNVRDMYMRMLSEFRKEDLRDAVVGNNQAVLAGRISHQFHLKGASMVIDTACSSSFAALDTAARYVKSGSIDAALVGGIHLKLMPYAREGEEIKVGIESGDGLTRTFDACSDGTVFGESVEMIMIKPLSIAERDGDHIYGIIRGIAVNQDGNSAGITAPNPKAQEEVITEAWEDAGIHPELLDFVEVHGTGTRIGDAIEYASLNKAFRRYTGKMQICPVTAIKPNYGHMSEGSGLFSLIKGLLCLQYNCIPANRLFNIPNPSISMIDTAIYPLTRTMPWQAKEKPRMFAVSNFGLSGTNAHVVVQEYRQPHREAAEPVLRIITLSNRTKSGLLADLYAMIGYLSKYPAVEVGDLSYTLNTGRGQWEHRVAIPAEHVPGLVSGLEETVISLKAMGDAAYYSYIKVIPDEQLKESEYDIFLREKEAVGEKAAEIERSTDNLAAAAELYLEGADIDWSGWYMDRKYYTVPLPPYNFEKNSCWIEVPTGTVSPISAIGKPIPQDQRSAIESLSLFGRNGDEGAYSTTEWELAKSVRRILGLREIGVWDNFYEMGADSILLGRIFIDISRKYEGLVRFTDLSEYTSIARLAEYIEQRQKGGV